MEESPNREPEAKLVKTGSENEYLSDLIVLGLPYKATEDDVKDYFTQFGELAMHEIKYDPVSKQSRGFAFIRFKTVAAAQKAIKSTHNILGRRCEVRLPKKKEEPPKRKLFIGRLPDDTNKEDLEDYFGKFGILSDVYIPTPFRGFGFVTFDSSDVANGVLLQKQHTLKNARINVTHAEPKDEKGKSSSSSSRSSRDSRGSSRSSSRRYQEPPFDFKDMREGIPQSSIHYTPHIACTTHRSPSRDIHDSRQAMPYTTVTSYNDYRPIAAPAYAPPAQPFDSRELQYGAYWSTSK